MESPCKSNALDGKVAAGFLLAWRASAAAVACGLVCGAATRVCRGSDGGFSEDFGRYEVIFDKTPFGAPPPSSAPGAEPGGGAAAPEQSAAASMAAGGGEASPVKLSSVSRFGGVAAAGLVDCASGVAFLLRPGESFGAYRLLDVDLELGAAVVARGTNEWLVSLEWASGQPTNIVPSAREPYFTAFRPGLSPAAGPSTAAAAASGAPEALLAATPGADAAAPAAARAKRAAAVDTAISPEEEAELVAKATVADADGSTHVSFRELNRLRAKLRREKAEAAREAELAAAEMRRAESARLAQLAERERKRDQERESADRRAVIEAIAMGYDVGQDVELTEEEAAELREAGFQLPD